MAAIKNRNYAGLGEQDSAILTLENYLQHTLEPVHPRQKFIKDLRGRLVYPTAAHAGTYNDIKVESPNEQGISSLVLILAGIIGSLIVIITGIKATLTLIDVIKTLRLSKNQVGNKISRNRSASLIKSTPLGN